jgi:hypothetical protein
MHRQYISQNSNLYIDSNNVVLLCVERRVKKHCFHEWGRKKSRVQWFLESPQVKIMFLLS